MVRGQTVIVTFNLFKALRGIFVTAVMLTTIANPGLAATGKGVAGTPGVSGQDATAGSATGGAVLRELVAAGRLSDLRWPDFSDYRDLVKNFYESDHYSPVWQRNNQPSQQAKEVIEALQRADSKGLNSEDYDASRWP
jgi:hypothetical protein